MMQPINYLQNVADPFAQVLSGLKIGATMADMDAARETQRLAAEKQQAELQRINQYQTGVNKVLANPNRTWSDWEPLLAIAPNKDQIEAIKLMGDRGDARVKKSQQNFVANVLLSLEQNPEFSKEILDERIQAEPDPQQKQLYQTIRKAVDISPEKAAQITELGGAALFGEDWYKGIVNVRQERRAAAEAPSKLQEAQAKAKGEEAKAQVAFETAPDEIAKAKALRQYEQAKATTAAVEAKYAEKLKLGDLEKMGADLGLTKAQTGSALATSRKLGIESQKATLELAALKATGGMDPAKTFDQEEKLRKEYQGRTKIYSELGSTYQNIKASSEAKNGPGDIALITGFMKMLDPGSVVRETEFATARDTAGLYERLLNTSQKLQSGQLFALDSKQRQEYVNLAKQYLDSAQKKANEDKKALGVVVKNYRLNPDNVFGQEPVGGGRGAVNPSRVVTVDY